MRFRLKARWRSADGYIRFGLIATVLFLLFVLAASFGHLQDERDISIYRWQAFMRSSPNEMGDALAGTFSGLAFLWIIVTVLIQGKELRLQRKELAMTRSELSGQRQASQEMAEAMKSQALALKAQVSIIQYEQQARLQADAGKLSDEYQLSFKKAIKSISNLSQFERVEWVASGPSIHLLTFRDTDTLDRMFSSNLDAIVVALNNAISELRRLAQDGRITVRSANKILIENVLQEIQRLQGLSSQLSEWDQEKLSRLELPRLAAILVSLRDDPTLWADAP